MIKRHQFVLGPFSESKSLVSSIISTCAFLCFVQKGEWSAEKAFLDQQLSLLEQQSQDKARRLEDNISSLQTDRQRLQDTVVGSDCLDS